MTKDERLGDAHQGLTVQVRNALRTQIVAGTREPGSRLVEADLAEEFGVSRVPTREALRLLSVEGFVELLPRRGAVVAQRSAEDGEFLFELREPLEIAAAGAAARRGTRQSYQAITDVLAAAAVPLAKGDIERLSALNFEFHDAIAKASGNPYLADLLRPLRWKMQSVFAQSAPSRYRLRWEEHERLAEAIVTGNEREAKRLAAHHMRVSRKAYTAALVG